MRDVGPEYMKTMTAAQIVFGLVPACFMIMMAFAGVVIGTEFGSIFLLGSIVGTYGMGWAVFGYDRRRALVVFLLLLIGELTMLRALVPILMQVASGPHGFVDVLLGLYLTLAPFVVGAAHVVSSSKQAFARKAVHAN
jgi:hypothetical protein